VQFQLARRKPRFQRLSQRRCLRLAATVTDDVISFFVEDPSPSRDGLAALCLIQ
jgi:hypothetical protein